MRSGMIVGLTGGVASGKSLVSGELKRLGAHIIDADRISREILHAGSPAYLEITGAFGEGVLNADGTIDRKALARIVFADRGKLALLNRITHPPIIEEIRARIKALIERFADPLIVVDAALLIEAGLNKEMSKVIVVYADEEKQIKRMIERDHLSVEEAMARINAQMPLARKIKYADYVIDNNGSVEDTRRFVRELYVKLDRG